MASTHHLRHRCPGFLEALVLVGCMLQATVSQAQVTNPTNALNTVVTPRDIPGGGKQYDITGGTRPARGPNLFHNFERFSLPGTQDIANFCNTAACSPVLSNITNILGRVTGGPSDIFGRIQTTGFGAANLFLINPAGWIFRPTASLNVGGAFHVSTADYVGLRKGSDGVEGIFYANLSKPTILTGEPPVAFGFVTPTPAPISIQGGNIPDRVLKAPTLSVVGGDVTIEGTAPNHPTLTAPGGRVQIVSVASPGEVTLNPDMNVASVAAFTRLGQIAIRGKALGVEKLIDASGSRGGTVFIRAGQLIVDHSSLRADTTGAATGAPLGMDLGARELVDLRHGAVIRTEAQTTGSAGSIEVNTKTLTVREGAQISSGELLIGHGGNVTVRAPESVSLSGGSEISSDTRAGTGGDIEVKTGRLSVRDGAKILSQGGFISRVTGQAGNVTVVAADQVSLAGDIRTGIFSRSESLANDKLAGNIWLSVGDRNLSVGTLTLTGGAQIQSGSNRLNGNLVTVTAGKSIVASDKSGISSQFFRLDPKFKLDAGGVVVSAPTVTLDNGFINTSTLTAHDAGPIKVNTDTLTLTRGGQIVSSSLIAAPGHGAGGDVLINARDSVVISGKSTTGVASSLFTTDVSSGIFSASETSGRGGDIKVQAGQVLLADGATISAKSSGTGNAGDVTIAFGGSLRMRNSVITTEATTADGGNILLSAGSRSLFYLLDSRITTSVGRGKGKGGNITIDPEFVVLDHSQVRADAFGGPGGKINIVSDFFLRNDSVLSASSALSTQGTITIQSRFTDVSSSVAPLPAGLLQAATLLRASCAARVAAGKASSLVVAGREGMPLGPGSYVPSPLMTPEPGGVEPSRSNMPHVDSFPRLSRSVFAPACSR